jgi:peptidoglycan/LPS O-acetylase OafA/YrhL
MSTQRNPEVDRLRGIAILLTFWCHTTVVVFPWKIHFSRFFSDSWFGVDLFFVISGFVVSRSLAPKLDAAIASGRSVLPVLREFFIRRFVRLMPAAWAWYGVYVIFSLCGFEWFSPIQDVRREAIPIIFYYYNYYQAHYTFALGHFWSLSVEEQFYLFLPLCLVFAKSNRARLWTLAGIALFITLLLRPVLAPGLKEWPVARTATHLRMDTLLLGCLLYFGAKGSGVLGRLKPRFEMPWILSTLLGTLIIVSMFALAYVFPEFHPTLRIDFAYPGVGLASAVLVWAAAQGRNWIFPNLGWFRVGDALEKIGLRSYSIYLSNSIMVLFNKAMWMRAMPHLADPVPQHHKLGIFATAVVLTGITSEISYHYAEKFPLAWLDQRRKIKGMAVPAVIEQRELGLT